jgi:hypothetical protein
MSFADVRRLVKAVALKNLQRSAPAVILAHERRAIRGRLVFKN